MVGRPWLESETGTLAGSADAHAGVDRQVLEAVVRRNSVACGANLH